MRLTNPLWYLAAFLLALGSAMIGTAVAAAAFDPVRNTTVTATSERVDAAGKSLAVFTNDEEHGDIACRARGRDKKRIDIPQSRRGDDQERGRDLVPDRDSQGRQGRSEGGVLTD
ncbi:hypothetical protein [Aeromicrobium sp. UC242_57]|uniref:hypothetical protein n=1 Tax=Aeromicrobium sp. UC242_57 TaxID=3374624 RepID=UPI0037A194FA